MKITFLVLVLLAGMPIAVLAVSSQERLNAFDSVERSGINGKYYAGVEQGGDKVRIMVTDKWFRLTPDRKKEFMKQTGSLFLGMGGARGFKESGAFFVFTFVHKKSGETVGVLTSITGPEIYK